MPGPSAPVTEIKALLPVTSGTSSVAAPPSLNPLEQLEREPINSENAGELADFIGGPRLAFRLLAENINEVFWIGDSLRAQIFYCSPAYQPIWGRSCDSLRQQPWQWLDSIIPEDRDRYAGALEATSRGDPAEVQYRITRPDGVARWIRDRSFPVKGDGGEVYRIVGVAEDITDKRQAEENIRTHALENSKLVAQLKEAGKRKDEFLAVLAHELRNPLAPIRNSLLIFRAQGELAPELQWAKEVIDRQVHHMIRLVDDLLDVSRITTGKIELRKERVELAAIVSTAVEGSLPLIDRRNHKLTVTMPSEPIYLEADRVRLTQALMNLLNNAAKYSESGGRIELIAELTQMGAAAETGDGRRETAEKPGDGRRERAETKHSPLPPPDPVLPSPVSRLPSLGSPQVVLSIRDTGIGIRPDMLPRIFDMFVQADRSMDRFQGGLGIGLTLVQSLIEMHGGTIEARSEGPGKGSEFIVRLPAFVSSTPAESGEDGPSSFELRASAEARSSKVEGRSEGGTLPAQRRILIVDDNWDAAQSLAKLLGMTGNMVHIAHDGVEAIESAEQFRPHVVLLDIGLPRLDGYEAGRRIREQFGKDVFLIALTGWGQEDDRRRSHQAGFDFHMTKPLDFEALQQLLAASAT